MAIKITLIRHAAIAADLDGHYIGRSDPPLSLKGVAQAEQLARTLGRSHECPPETIWSSPALRARQTAERVSSQLACSITLDERLHEIDFGDWEGLTFDQILRHDPQRVTQWAAFADDFSFPAGEALKGFRQRIDDIVTTLYQQDGDHLIMITHGGVVRGLICQLLGWSLKDHLKFTIERGGYATLYLDGRHAVLTGLYNHGV